MTSYDFHGKTISEAETYLEQIIGKIRIAGSENFEEIALITGTGSMQIRLQQVLDSYGFDNYLDWNNLGRIIAKIE